MNLDYFDLEISFRDPNRPDLVVERTCTQKHCDQSGDLA